MDVIAHVFSTRIFQWVMVLGIVNTTISFGLPYVENIIGENSWLHTDAFATTCINVFIIAAPVYVLGFLLAGTLNEYAKSEQSRVKLLVGVLVVIAVLYALSYIWAGLILFDN